MRTVRRGGWRRACALARELLLLVPFALWGAVGAATEDESELGPDEGLTQREAWFDPLAACEADYGLHHDTDYLDGYDGRS